MELSKNDISLHNIGHKGNCNENIIKKSIKKTMSIPKDESVRSNYTTNGFRKSDDRWSYFTYNSFFI